MPFSAVEVFWHSDLDTLPDCRAANVHAPARLASLPAAAAASAEPSTATRVASTFLSMEEEDMTPDQLACRCAAVQVLFRIQQGQLQLGQYAALMC